MSVNIMEKVLWDLSVDRESKRRFQDDPEKFLSRYRLTELERRMIREFDVRGLADEGVSTMLTMGYWMETEGSRNIDDYLKRMQSPPRIGRDEQHTDKRKGSSRG